MTIKRAAPSKKRVGALLIFRDGVTANMAREVLSCVGLTDQIWQQEVHEFDPDREGWPVWYIP